MAAFSSSVFSGGASVSGVDDDINLDVEVMGAIRLVKVDGATTGRMIRSRIFCALVVVWTAARRATARVAGTANFPLKDMARSGCCNAIARRTAITRV